MTHQLVVDAVQFEQMLGFLSLQAHAAGDQVGELACVLCVHGHDGEFVGHLRFKLDGSAEEFLDGAHDRLCLQVLFHRPPE